MASDIRKFAKEEKSYLVVPVYADYADFGKCISFSLKKELDRNGIQVCFKGFFDEALGLVEKWINGEESAGRLKEECSKINIRVEDLKMGLSTIIWHMKKFLIQCMQECHMVLCLIVQLEILLII